MRSILVALLFGFLILPFTLPTTSATADEGRVAIVVLEPPVNFRIAAIKLGYIVSGEFNFEELSMKAIKVFLPVGRTVNSAVSELEKHFPDLVFGDNEV